MLTPNYQATTFAAYQQIISEEIWCSQNLTHDALAYFNWLRTHDGAKNGIKPLLDLFETATDVAKELNLAKHADLRMLGQRQTIQPGQKFAFLIKASRIQQLVEDPTRGDITGSPPDDLFDFFITKASWEKSKDPKRYRDPKFGLWLTDWDRALPAESDLIGWIADLGLYHFNLADKSDAVYAYQLVATQEVELLKPTWVHAFGSWYFDPTPDCVGYGMTRSLDTGLLTRKEWWLNFSEAAQCFKLDDYKIFELTLDHARNFRVLLPVYWEKVRERVLKFNES